MADRYPLPDLNALPEDIRTRILQVQDKAGFIPTVFLALARRPAEWRAFFAYHDALMEPESAGRASSLTKGDREMIVTATSAANHCLYCVVAHGALLRIYEKKPFVADQVAVSWRRADISGRQRAMLEFAMKICQRSHEVDEADFEALHAHGFDDEDIWTSPPSRRSSACPTAWPASRACSPMPSFSSWAACRARKSPPDC